MEIKNLTKQTKFNSELADNITSQSKGLSFSKEKRNMLFHFGTSRTWNFWMFGMSYDIWISFIDDKKRVLEQVYAQKMTLNPKTWRVYRPKKPCRYVLETPKKLADIGDKLNF
ncbi:MAG: DUF192 domain-containing protein [archaeon]